MRRRAFIGGLIPGLAPAAQSFGPTNPPTCPGCHTLVPKDAPALSPVVAEPDGNIFSMPKVRQMFCGNCGLTFICTP